MHMSQLAMMQMNMGCGITAENFPADWYQNMMNLNHHQISCLNNAGTSSTMAPSSQMWNFNSGVYSSANWGNWSEKLTNLQIGASNKTFEQPSSIFNDSDVKLSKSDMNLELLKEYEYATEEREQEGEDKPITIYICKHKNCNKEFTRTWNILDHARMHKGVKPYKCNFWMKQFTQKGNLRKHLKTHVMPNLEQRKRYKCEFCDSSYTERYNYKVSYHRCWPHPFNVHRVLYFYSFETSKLWRQRENSRSVNYFSRVFNYSNDP